MKRLLLLISVFGLLAGTISTILIYLWLELMVKSYHPDWFIVVFGIILIGGGMSIALIWKENFNKASRLASLPITETIDSLISRHGLSVAESEVLFLLLRGYKNEEIADIRNVSLNTVKTQVAQIYSKTGFSGRSKLIASVHPVKMQNHPKE